MTATDLLDHLGEALTTLTARHDRRVVSDGESRITHSEDETADVARELAAALQRRRRASCSRATSERARPRSCAASRQGSASIPEEVSSPTFTLVHEYRGGRLTLYHADLYRLETSATDDLGLEEMGVADGVLAIEWPDRLTHALTGRDARCMMRDRRRQVIESGPDGMRAATTPSGSSALPS